MGRSPAEGKDDPFQYSCLENSMYRGAWQVTVHEVTKSQRPLKKFSMHAHETKISCYSGTLISQFSSVQLISVTTCLKSYELTFV